MLHYVLRRSLLLIPIALATSVIIFLTLRLGTGGPTLGHPRLSNLPSTPGILTSIRTMLRLGQPPYVQYGTWLWKMLHLDFGISFASQRSVSDGMLDFLSATLELVGATLVLILFTSVPLGVWATHHRGRLPGFTTRSIAFLGVSMPNFQLAFLLMTTSSVYLQWLPAIGHSDWQHTVLPTVSIAFMSLAANVCLLRASILDIAGRRHAAWAWLRDLNDKQTGRHHILYNIPLLMITAVGMRIGELISGTMIIENIFVWPGIGHYAVPAIFNRDYSVIQCFILMMVVVLVICSLIIDLLSVALDPRTRRHEGAYV